MKSYDNSKPVLAITWTLSAQLLINTSNNVSEFVWLKNSRSNQYSTMKQVMNNIAYSFIHYVQSR